MWTALVGLFDADLLGALLLIIRLFRATCNGRLVVGADRSAL